MLIAIIAIIGALVGGLLGWFDDRSLTATIIGVFFGGFIAAIIGFVVTVVALAIYTGSGNAVVKLSHTDTPLVSLQDVPSIKGEFHGFIGVSGSIEGTMRYNYYVNEDGYALKTLDASKAKVLDDSDKPFVRAYSVDRLENDVADFLFGKSWLGEWPIERPQYELHVPKGSVTPTITLDAK